MQVLVVMALGAVLNYAVMDREVFSHIRQHYTFEQNPQWKLGLALQRAGIEVAFPRIVDDTVRHTVNRIA